MWQASDPPTHLWSRTSVNWAQKQASKLLSGLLVKSNIWLISVDRWGNRDVFVVAALAFILKYRNIWIKCLQPPKITQISDFVVECLPWGRSGSGCGQCSWSQGFPWRLRSFRSSSSWFGTVGPGQTVCLACSLFQHTLGEKTQQETLASIQLCWV